MAILEEKYRVNIENIGISNLITNTGILRILENIACRHSDIVGFGVNDISVTHLSWVLLAWKVQILKRVTYGTELTVRTWAKAANKFNTYRDFEILDESGNVICIATSKWTLINTEKGSIERISDEIIEKYKPEAKNVFEDSEVKKLLEPETHSVEYIYTTQRKDIDINHHMHNLNYLSLAYEALPIDIYNAPEYNNVEIMYKKGIQLGDTVKCFYSFTDSAHFITLRSEDEKTLHAIIKLY